MNLIGILTRAFLGLSPAPAPKTPAVVVAVAAPEGAAAAAQVSAADAVDKVQKFYASINQVTALFRQTVTNATFGSTKDSDGKVWIQKPGKMRWDYSATKAGVVQVKKSFISNGSYLYVVEHDNKQVMKKNLNQDLMPVAVSFLYGKGDLKAEFNPVLDTSRKYGEKGDLVLQLTPKQPSAQYKYLYLVVNPTDFHVSQSIIIDSSNNVNHFRFYSPDFKSDVKPTWFEFDEKAPAVKNYRIVDADAQGAGAGSTDLVPSPMPPGKK